MIGCSTNERDPSAAFFCSNHDNPRPWACSEVTTSLRPSPFTSYTAISAPPGLDRVHLPKAAGWYFHNCRSSIVDCRLGCSHHPNALRKSTRPSPLTSPTPMPWLAHGPGSLMAYFLQ